MDYQEKNKEFYGAIEKLLEGVDSLNLCENKKSKLYLLIDETIQRLEKDRTNYFKTERASGSLDKSLKKIYQKLERIVFMMEEEEEAYEEISGYEEDFFFDSPCMN